MNLKKIFAVGLAMGVVGIANAASPLGAGDEPYPAATKINMTYTVNLTGEITVTPNAALDVTSAAFTHGATPAVELGKVNVKTNYSAWDVIMAAQNGGTFQKGGIPEIPAIRDEFNNIITPAVPAVPGDKLQYIDNTSVPGTPSEEDVVLNVAIVLNQTALASGNVGELHTTDAIELGDDPVSFAEEIGGISTFTTAFPGTGQAGAAIAADGFGIIATETYLTHGVTFTVLGGFGLAPADKIAGNKNGDYEETLTFTLIANY